MRVAVISDIHGNLPALEAVLADVASQAPDMTFNLGDSVSGPIAPAAVADLLIERDFPTVLGNHDRWVVDPPKVVAAVDRYARGQLSPAHLDWIRRTPATLGLPDIFLCHGTPQSDEEPWLDSWWNGRTHTQPGEAEVTAKAEGLDFPVLLCGHTHTARAVRLADGRLIVNPGSVGLHFNLGLPLAQYAVVERRNGTWSVTQRAIPYDRAAAARAAEANGFANWTRALMSGWPSPLDLFLP